MLGNDGDVSLCGTPFLRKVAFPKVRGLDNFNDGLSSALLPRRRHASETLASAAGNITEPVPPPMPNWLQGPSPRLIARQPSQAALGRNTHYHVFSPLACFVLSNERIEGLRATASKSQLRGVVVEPCDVQPPARLTHDATHAVGFCIDYRLHRLSPESQSPATRRPLCTLSGTLVTCQPFWGA